MVEILSERASFGGVLRICRHQSDAVGLPMRFAVYLPPHAEAAAGRCARPPFADSLSRPWQAA